MLKQLLVGSSLCAGLWMVALPVQAQTPGSQAPDTEAPSPRPAQPTTPAPGNTAPNATPGTTAPTNTEVSDGEIEKFANAIKEFQTIQQDAQQQATQILEGEQLSWERFNQILQSQRNPEAQPASPEVSAAERQRFDQAISKLDELRQSTNQRMDQALASQQLERQRFAEILAMVRQDSGLRQRIEQELQN